MALSVNHRRALADVARIFGEADVQYQVGGSAMLALHGFDVAVGDIDVVVAGSARDRVDAALVDLVIEIPVRREPWRTDWLIRAQLQMPDGPVGLDVMGGLALVIDGSVARFPLVVERHVSIDGWEIPLAPLAHWYHLYRVHNPEKAALIRKRLDDAAVREAACALSID